MNIKEIERLLGKFYEGGTTLDEERQLREFFLHGEVPEHLAKHRSMFTFFSDEEKEEITNPGFDRLMDEKLTEAPVIRMYSRKQFYALVSAAAAAVILVIGIFFGLKNDINRHDAMKQAAVPENDTVAAYHDAEDALAFVSMHLNEGLVQVRRLDAFNRGMDKMEIISTFYNYSTIVINPDEIAHPSTNLH